MVLEQKKGEKYASSIYRRRRFDGESNAAAKIKLAEISKTYTSKYVIKSFRHQYTSGLETAHILPLLFSDIT